MHWCYCRWPFVGYIVGLQMVNVKRGAMDLDIGNRLRPYRRAGKWESQAKSLHPAAAKSLQSCPTLCDPTDVSPPGSPVPGILQAVQNTGVGCHFLLQCMKVKSKSEAAQSCPTLSDPMDCSLPGSSIHGIFQARVLEWGAIAISHYTLGKHKSGEESLNVRGKVFGTNLESPTPISRSFH